MTPFQEFRLWARRAPGGERASALITALVVLGLLVWALVPGGGTSSATAGSPQPTATSTSPTSGATPAAATTCASPPVAAQGVTATTMKVAVVLTDITGAASNASEGVLPVGAQKTDYTAVIHSINASGGVCHHQLVPQYFDANPADQSQLQQNCLAIVQAGVFAVLDAGGYASFPQVNCFAEHKLPYIGSYTLPAAQLAKFSPYMFEFTASDSEYKTAIVALKARGFYSAQNGFKKLGLIYQSCNPQLHTEVAAELATAGVPASSIVSFDVGCPAIFTSAITLQQAILKFKHDGVTNVNTVSFTGDFPTFTKLAQLQHFDPIYGIADDQIISTSYGSSAPDYPNIANAIAISENRNGEERTPGAVPTPGTVACNKIEQAVGQPTVYKAPAAAGNVCDEMWEFRAMVDHAPTLSQTSLAAGLKAAKTVTYSYPEGPNDFSTGTPYGGQYYRVNQFHTSCNCWQLLSQAFQRSTS